VCVCVCVCVRACACGTLNCDSPRRGNDARVGLDVVVLRFGRFDLEQNALLCRVFDLEEHRHCLLLLELAH
jgi:hypothetical protein